MSPMVKMYSSELALKFSCSKFPCLPGVMGVLPGAAHSRVARDGEEVLSQGYVRLYDLLWCQGWNQGQVRVLTTGMPRLYRKSGAYYRPPFEFCTPQIVLSSRALNGKRREETRTGN